MSIYYFQRTVVKANHKEIITSGKNLVIYTIISKFKDFFHKKAHILWNVFSIEKNGFLQSKVGIMVCRFVNSTKKIFCRTQYNLDFNNGTLIKVNISSLGLYINVYKLVLSSICFLLN